MQKIIVKTLPDYNRSSIISTVIYLGTLSAVTYVFYIYTSPLTVLQVLLSWAIIYNTGLLFLGTPPTIDNIYFLGNDEENRFFPYLDGSHQKFSVFTELFVCFASSYIYDTTMRNEYLSMTNLFTLLLIIHFWRKLIFLLRGTYRFGQSLENSVPSHYVRQGDYKLDNWSTFLFYMTMPFFISFLNIFQQHYADELGYWGPLYIIFVGLGGILPQETDRKMIRLTIVPIVYMYFADIPYSLVLFSSFSTILFIYLIFIWAKDILLRESHIYLSDELTCDALKQDVKAQVQSLVERNKSALYWAVCLYSIFITLLFFLIFRLDFARQISKALGLDYFYNIIIP